MNALYFRIPGAESSSLLQTGPMHSLTASKPEKSAFLIDCELSNRDTPDTNARQE